MMKTRKLEVKNYIAMGIYSVIYSIVAFVIGGIVQMTPVTFPFMPMVIAIFLGPIFIIYTIKIPKKGALTILGLIVGIFLLITGMFWMMGVSYMVTGLLADIILYIKSKSIKSLKKNVIAYVVFSLGALGAYLPMVILPKQFDDFMSKKDNANVFIDIIHNIGSSNWIFPSMIIGTCICAVIGGLIGINMYKKYFEKSGVA